MNDRSLPPFVLFEHWGISHHGTLGECADELRCLYASSNPDEKQIPISNAAYCENLRTFRLINCMSLRYVSKKLGMRRRRLKDVESGNLKKLRLYPLLALLDLYGDEQSLFVKLDNENALLHDIASEEPLPVHLFPMIKSICSRMEEVLKHPPLDLSSIEGIDYSNVPIEKAVGENLLWLRNKKSLSVEEASRRSGASTDEITKLESGDGADIALSTLVELCSVYEEPCPIKLMLPDYAIEDADRKALVALAMLKTTLCETIKQFYTSWR